MSLCAGCLQPIHDKWLLNVLSQNWHAECLRCSDCGERLNGSCFTRDGILLCKADFSRRYAARCAGCDGCLERDDLVRRAKDKVFHLSCFQCSICQRTLNTGEQLFVLDGSGFVCETDYALAQSKITPAVSTSAPAAAVSLRPVSAEPEATSEIEEDIPEGSSEGVGADERDNEDGKQSDDPNSAKRRGPRTTIKAKQLETLKTAFASTPKPTRHIREQLAAETGLNMRVIQVWFQNRRSKERRMKQMRFGGFRPLRRSRGGTREDGMPHEAFSAEAPPGFFGPPPPLGFYCDVYSGMPPPPPGLPSDSRSLVAPHGMTAFGLTSPDGTPPFTATPQPESVVFERSPLSQPNSLTGTSDADEESFRCITSLYPPDMKHALPGW